MASTTIITQRYTTTDGKTIVISYDPDGNTLVNAEIVIDGQRYSWCTVEAVEDFMNSMISAINLIHSTSGAGAGYVAASPGTASTVDPIVD
jgi:hypothetical protein